MRQQVSRKKTCKWGEWSDVFIHTYKRLCQPRELELWVGWKSVEWRCCGIGLDPWLWIKGLRVPVNAWHFCPLNSKTLYPHCCSPPRCMNGYPVGCERYLSLDVACVCPWSGAWPECSPGSLEGALWVQDWHWIQWLGVIIHCKSLCVVSHTRKVLYKN